MIEISVIIPVYRGADCLQELRKRLAAVFAMLGVTYEIVFVDDRSPDHAWQVLSEMSKAEPAVRAVRLSRNFGQHNAITAGLDLAKGNWIVVMDCDLQDQPEEIAPLYRKALEGYDVVVARRGRRKDPLHRRLTSHLFYASFRLLSGMKYDHEVGNFRIISRKVVDQLIEMREQLRFFGGMVEWLGFSKATVDVEHAERFAGESSYNFRRLIRLAAQFILAHSDRPLKFFIFSGFSIALLSFLFGLWILVRTLIWGTSIQGWASLIVSIYFMGGIILASLGVIGVYLGKVYQEAKGRPLYVIDQRINFE